MFLEILLDWNSLSQYWKDNLGNDGNRFDQSEPALCMADRLSFLEPFVLFDQYFNITFLHDGLHSIYLAFLGALA